jgi:hypothetical protein
VDLLCAFMFVENKKKFKIANDKKIEYFIEFDF